jgi:hypothetical protein
VQVLPAGPACHPLLPTSHPSILGEPALARPLQKAPLLTSTYAAAVVGPCSQPSPLHSVHTCRIAGAAGVSTLRIAVPRSEKPETDRKIPGWLLNQLTY